MARAHIGEETQKPLHFVAAEQGLGVKRPGNWIHLAPVHNKHLITSQCASGSRPSESP